MVKTLNNSLQKKILEAEKLYVQGEFEKSLTEVTKLKQEQKSDANFEYDLIILESKILNDSEKRDESIKLAEHAIKLAKSLKNTEKELYAMIYKLSSLANLESVLKRQEEITKIETIITEIENLYNSSTDLSKEASKRIQVLFTIQKGLICFFQDDFRKAEKLYMESYLELKKDSNIPDQTLVLRRLSFLHLWAGHLDKALEFSEEWRKLSKQINNKRNIIKINGIQSKCYIEKGNNKKAIELLLATKRVLQSFDSKYLKSTTSAYLAYAHLMSGDLDLSLKYGLEGLDYSKELSSHFLTFWLHLILGYIYIYKGDLDKTLFHANKALDLKEAGAWKRSEAQILTLIGDIYHIKGEYDKAIDSYLQSISLFGKEHTPYNVAGVHFNIIGVYHDLNKVDEASHHLKEIKRIASETDNNAIKHMSMISEALIYKTINTPRLRGKAESLFEQVLLFPNIKNFIQITAFISLCELLLVEVTETGERELLDRINVLVSQLEETAISQKSDSLLAETYLIQSKIALAELDFALAKNKLTAAQKLAENKGFEKLVKEIEIEIEEFQENLTFWNGFIQQKPSIKDTIKHSQLDKAFHKLNKDRKEIISTSKESTEIIRKLFVLKI